MRTVIVILCLNFLLLNCLKAQEIVTSSRYLYKPVSLKAENESLEDVLQKIGSKGNFYFSYNSNLIPKDSIVTLSVQNTPVIDILDKLLKGEFEYKESSGYVIIRPAFRRLSITPETINHGKNSYVISGHIRDETSGMSVNNASVYEKRLLKSTLTNDDGYFKLKFRGEHPSVILTVSKDNYRDTTVMFLSSVHINPNGYNDSITDKKYRISSLVERTGVARLLVSSRQRIQNLNIPAFLANTPFQTSLLPGLSSHGMLSSRVVNKASLNIIGGYTAGVNGVEVAGLFNINNSNVKYVQVGGLTNISGGSVTGVQVGGVVNTVLNTVTGVQIAGIFNGVKDSVEGVQIAGIGNAVLNPVNGFQLSGVFNGVKSRVEGAQVGGVVNTVKGDFKGFQTGGVLNLDHDNFNGIQIAGIFNFTGNRFRGIQIGLINYSKKMEGLQVGFFNVADTSTGASIGLFNWVTKGYHQISVSANEITPLNLAYKSGNANFYTILSGGMNMPGRSKIYTAGFGFGHEFIPDKRLSVSAELSGQYIYLGSFKQTNTLCKLGPALRVKLFKPVSLFAGPTYTVFYSDPLPQPVEGYRSGAVPAHHQNFSNNLKGWLGWNAGITLF